MQIELKLDFTYPLQMKYQRGMMLLLFCLLSMPAIGTEKTQLLILDGDNIEPYSIAGQKNQEPSGIQAELFRAIFADSKFAVHFLLVPLYRVSSEINSLHADGSTRMDESDIAGYRSSPYIAYHACLITTATKRNYKSVKEVKTGRIIGFQHASSSFSQELNDALTGNPNYSEVNDQSKQVFQLLTGHVDAIIADFYIASFKKELLTAQHPRLQKKNLKCDIDLQGKAYQAFFINKEPAIAFDKGLHQIVEDGTYDKILEKYGVKNKLKPN